MTKSIVINKTWVNNVTWRQSYWLLKPFIKVNRSSAISSLIKGGGVRLVVAHDLLSFILSLLLSSPNVNLEAILNNKSAAFSEGNLQS